MQSMDILTTLDNPLAPTSHGPEEALQQLQQLQLDIREQVMSSASKGDSFDSTERTVWETVRRIGYAAMELLVQLQGTGDLGEQLTTAEGQRLQRSEEPQPTVVRSIFGEHRFQQYTYRKGPKKKVELRPISTRLQLPEGRWSYLLEEFSQMFCVDQAYNQASSNLERVFGLKHSVDTLERVNARMGQLAGAFLDELPAPAPESESEILVASTDCKGVPLIKENTEPVAAFQTARKRPGNRRMAAVTSVYSVSAYERTAEEIIAALFRDTKQESGVKRPKPSNKHTMAHLPTVFVDEGEEVAITSIYEGMSWLAAQVAQRHREDQKLVLLMDGQLALWEAALVCLGETARIEILDIIHVSAYVWEAAALLTSTETERLAFTRARLLKILQGQVAGVIRGLRRLGSIAKLRAEKQRDLRRICGYLEKHQDRMRYDEYLAAGYPIASGVIEGACGHLVKDRMERSGMRWNQESAREMLNLRAAFQSSYWDQFCRQRVDLLGRKLHPHCDLIADYKPMTLAC